MKLEKNNKYSKKLTNGLSAILLSVSILSGCGTTSSNIEDPIEIVNKEEIKEELDPNDVNYYYDCSLLELTDEEKEEKMEALNIKYPDTIHLAPYVDTIIVRDSEENYKILQVLTKYDFDNNIIHIYDVFTEDFLFDIPYKNFDNITIMYDVYNGYDLTKITNKIAYFDDKEIIEYGTCRYSTYFIFYYIKDIINRTGINYKFSTDKYFTYLYPDTNITSKLKVTTKQIADNYITTVPQNMQVTAEELGVEITYPEERKYADFWKIGDEEKKERYNLLNVTDENLLITMDQCFALILKDNMENYKLLLVCYFIRNDKIEFYNIFTSEFLFSINNTEEFVYDYDNNRFIVDFHILKEAIPYFLDKLLIKLDSSFAMNSFIVDYIDLKSNTDEIKYDYPDDGWRGYLFPHEETSFNTGDIEHTIKEIGEAYVTIIPKELQVTAEELKIGMIEEKSDDTNKVLVK